MDLSTELFPDTNKTAAKFGESDSLKTSQRRRSLQNIFYIRPTQLVIFTIFAIVLGAIVFSTSFFERSRAALLNLALSGNQEGQVVCPNGTLTVTEHAGTSMRVSCLISEPSPPPSSSPQASASPSPVASPSLPPGNSDFQPFGEAVIPASDIAFEVDGAGVNVDTIAFWEAPDPNNSLMFVSSKNVSLVEVWQYPFQQSNGLNDLTDSCLNDNTNGVIVDQETDELYVAMSFSGRVCVFNVPSMTLARTIETGATSNEPNFALLKKPSGEKWLYVSNDRHIFVHDAVTGALVSGFTNPFDAPHQSVETAFADNYYQKMYVPTEDGSAGVNVLSPEGVFESEFGSAAIFDLDEEGIWVYSCPKNGQGDDGTGLIMISDQFTPTEIEVFDRVSKNHLGKFTVAGVDNTDGIALTQQASPVYPEGLFTAIDNDGTTVGVSLQILMQKLGLSCGV